MFSALRFEHKKNPLRLGVAFSRMWFYGQQAELLPPHACNSGFHQAPK